MGQRFINLFILLGITLVLYFGGSPGPYVVPGILLGVAGLGIYLKTSFNLFILDNPFLFTRKEREEINKIAYYLSLFLMISGLLLSWKIPWYILLD